ncbi:MAG TPA: diacylglycerol kinase family protein [Symbiobacteriaceae bacterium]|nr:diacylglycerol kinase family protein [Symbiobacteriaceae bacterium]
MSRVTPRSFARSLQHALGGFTHAYRAEAHLRFHLLALAGALSGARASLLEGWELAYLLVSAVAVIGTELINTAIERVVDLAAGGRIHPLARQAKDVAAGSVLVMAAQAILAGLWLFGWRRSLLTSIAATLSLFVREPWWALLVIVALVGLFWPPHRRPDTSLSSKEDPR